MTPILKQSTAVTLLIGPFLDEDDGKTAEAGLAIAQADVRLSMNGGNMAQKTDAAACVHDELGYYTCDLDGTDTAALGILKVMVHEGGALPVWHDFMVIPANEYDSLILGTDALDVEVASMAAGTVTAAAVATDAIDDDAVAADVYTAINAEVVDALGTDAIAEMAQGIPPTTPTIVEAIMYMYMALTKRNDVGAAVQEYYNNADVVVWKQVLSEAAGVASKTKGASGP